MKLAIINRGVVATGKSSFVKEITEKLSQNSYNFEVCSTDDFFMENGEYNFDFTKLQEYHLKNQDKFFNALKNKIDVVICDNTNLEPWESKPYYNMAKEFDYKVLILDFIPREKEEILSTQIHNVPNEVIEEMMKKYQKTDIKEFAYDEVIHIQPNEFNETKNIIGDLIVKKIKNYSINQIEIIPYEYRVIIEEFHKRTDKTLTAYDIKHLIDKSTKQIERYFDNLAEEFKNIIKIKRGKKKAYKLIDNFDIFVETFKNTEDLEELFYLAKESNPELFKRLDYNLKNDEIYMFRGAIFEALQDKKYFNNLKSAIQNSEYRIIKFFGEDKKEIKPIKLVFIDNNWYVAYVENDILKLGRISFIEKVEYSKKNSYQKYSVKGYLNILQTKLQNSMTLFDKEKKIAKIQVTPNVSKYFKEEMKKFLSSQKFIEEKEDGSVIFTLEYTQSLEILPFIQRWLPDLIILSPQDLKEEYLEKLTQTINNLKN